MAEKGKQYGHSFKYDGMLGTLVQICECAARLKNIFTTVPVKEWKKEVLFNLLIDLHNFSLIALERLEQGDYFGTVSLEITEGDFKK